MTIDQFTFSAEVWRWQGAAPAAWHFITLPDDVAGQIKFMIGKRQGFGSVKVKVLIGETSWKTSLFPDKKSGSFLLPIKAEVRNAEALVAGKTAKVRLTVSEV
jgi:Domain of unknown function (DUF1905)